MLTAALADAARERDNTVAEATQALREAEDMAYELRLVNERNSEIFSRLEDAMTISVEPLEKMFRKVGLDPDQLIDTVRRGYSGRGGPLTPISVSTRGEAPSPEAARANRLLMRLDELSLYRLAADKVPLALPVNGGFRYTSGFGMRWGRMHKGTDFAARTARPSTPPPMAWSPMRAGSRAMDGSSRSSTSSDRDALCPHVQNPGEEGPKGLAWGPDR